MSTIDSNHANPAAACQAQDSAVELVVHDLGRMDYAGAYAIQKRLQQEVIDQREAAENGQQSQSSAGQRMHLILVEHDPPVITISRRPGSRRHLIATDSQLKAAGVEVAETDRGGDITYHGPGQLVVYPILDLNRLNLRLISYLRFLEQIVINVLGRFGIDAVRDESATGVWVPQPRLDDAAPADAQRLQPADVSTASATDIAKICAIGVRASKWVTMHGLALNVTTNLDHFNLIIPCGLVGRDVTSMQRMLRERCPTMDDVKRAMVDEFRLAVGMAGQA